MGAPYIYDISRLRVNILFVCRQFGRDSYFHELAFNTIFEIFNVIVIFFAFFWVIPRRLNFICRRFGTLCVFHLHRQVDVGLHLPAYEDGTECSEMSAYKIQKPGNYPEESIKHSKHGKSLKSGNGVILIIVAYEWC